MRRVLPPKLRFTVKSGIIRRHKFVRIASLVGGAIRDVDCYPRVLGYSLIQLHCELIAFAFQNRAIAQNFAVCTGDNNRAGKPNIFGDHGFFSIEIQAKLTVFADAICGCASRYSRNLHRVAVVTIQRVLACSPVDQIIATIAFGPVSALARINLIVFVARTDRVVAAVSLDHVHVVGVTRQDCIACIHTVAVGVAIIILVDQVTIVGAVNHAIQTRIRANSLNLLNVLES